jgi:DNA mismatch repair ATPase MutS
LDRAQHTVHDSAVDPRFAPSPPRSVLIAALRTAATRIRHQVVERVTRQSKTDVLPIDERRLGAYHAHVADAATTLRERSWSDLDMDAVFLRLDRTRSDIGAQYLYHLLRTPLAPAERSARIEEAVARFSDDSHLATAARRSLTRLRGGRSPWIERVLLADPPPSPGILLPLALATCSIGSLLAMLAWPPMGIALLVACVINAGFAYFQRHRMELWGPGLRMLPELFAVADALAALANDALPVHAAALRESSARLHSLRRASRWLRWAPEQTNELAATASIYVSMLLLLDVNAFARAVAALRGQREAARTLFETIGFLDAAQSIAEWRRSLDAWSTPTFAEDGRDLSVEKLAHPLIAEPVPATIDAAGRGLLVTGSNMSGKTTFVRTIGVNAILAQSLNTVCGRRWRAPRLDVLTVIDRSEDLQSGTSYYMSEVAAVRVLVDAAERPECCLFLVDELFRGTNRAESIAGNVAILRYLQARGHIVIATTHDEAVVAELRPEFDAYGFRSRIVDGRPAWDYALRPGVDPSRSAIALLESTGFPAAVVKDARSLLRA